MRMASNARYQMSFPGTCAVCTGQISEEPSVIALQSVFSTPEYNSTWNVSLQNLDLYTSGPLQYQIRASCSAQKQCPSPSISLAGSSAGSPQLCSGDNFLLLFHLGAWQGCQASHIEWPRWVALQSTPGLSRQVHAGACLKHALAQAKDSACRVQWVHVAAMRAMVASAVTDRCAPCFPHSN